MTTAPHTTGTVRVPAKYPALVTADGSTLADCRTIEGSPEVQMANARRLALCWNAHDDLLAACESALQLESSIDQEAWYSNSQCPDAFRLLRAAVEKATGPRPA